MRLRVAEIRRRCGLPGLACRLLVGRYVPGRWRAHIQRLSGQVAQEGIDVFAHRGMATGSQGKRQAPAPAFAKTATHDSSGLGHAAAFSRGAAIAVVSVISALPRWRRRNFGEPSVLAQPAPTGQDPARRFVRGHERLGRFGNMPWSLVISHWSFANDQ